MRKHEEPAPPGVIRAVLDAWRSERFALLVSPEGRAEYVVSGDRLLLVLRTHRGIAIVPPRAFLAALPAVRPQ